MASPLRVTRPNDPPAENVPDLITATDTPPGKVQWLLPGRLIGACLSIVEGPTSAGKSVFIAGLVASITTGREWCGRPKGEPGNVLWLTGEEDPGSMVRPRLIAAEADTDRVHFPPRDDLDVPIRFTLPSAVQTLRALVGKYRLSLIVIEPLASHIDPSLTLIDETACRAVLDPVQALCFQSGVSVLLTRGLTKNAGSSLIDAGKGNGAILECARSAVRIDQPDQGDQLRTLRVVKCGQGGQGSVLTYRHDTTNGVPIIKDITEVSDPRALDVMADLDPGERDQRISAETLLREVIGADWVPFTEIEPLMHQAGISKSTLWRAKRRLGVRDKRVGFGKGSRSDWGPPEDGFPPLKGGTPGEVNSMEPMQKPLKKRRKKP